MLLNSEPNDEECDATKVDSSNDDDNIKMFINVEFKNSRWAVRSEMDEL